MTQKMPLCLMTIALCSMVWNCAFSQTMDQTTALRERELILPSLGDREPCPASKGRTSTVPEEDYIFGAGGYWYGNGPVYFGLSWKIPDEQRAVFSIDRVPLEGGEFRAKTPWVSSPSYSGPILVRGKNLKSNDRKNELRFSEQGAQRANWLVLASPNAPAGKSWSFWPTLLWLPGAGCFGIQIDTLIGTDVVVFEATHSAREAEVVSN